MPSAIPYALSRTGAGVRSSVAWLTRGGRALAGPTDDLILTTRGTWVPASKFGGTAANAVTRVSGSKGISVIGPRTTYRQYAQSIDARFLNVSDQAWTWEKNRRYLYGVAQRGDDVIFAGKFSPAKLDPGSVLAREIKYLTERGYRWTDNFSRLGKVVE